MALNDPILGEVTWRRSATGLTAQQVLTDANDYETNGIEGRYRFALQLEVAGTPTTGTLLVEARVPGASAYVEVASLSMADGDNPQISEFTGVYDAVRVTPSSFDGSSFDVFLAAMDG